ncbi:MAG: MAPEG family protein [Gammaproteobacteria bacterium]
MATALWILLAAMLIPIICGGISKVSGGEDRYDNANPREWLARRTGYQARANGAQANSWEALATYIAGLTAAFIGGVDPATVGLIASIFLVARIAYVACYLANLATLRSLTWLVGFGSCICLIVMGAQRVV